MIGDNDRQDDMHHVYCATSLQPGTNIEGLLALKFGKALYLQYEVTIFCTRVYPPRVGLRYQPQKCTNQRSDLDP